MKRFGKLRKWSYFRVALNGSYFRELPKVRKLLKLLMVGFGTAFLSRFFSIIPVLNFNEVGHIYLVQSKKKLFINT